MDKRIIKYFAGELSQSERISLLEERKINQTLKDKFTAYRNLEGLISLSEYPNDHTNGKENLEKFMHSYKSQKRRKLFTGFIRYTAIIILIITGSWIASYHYYNHYDDVEYNEVRVPAGQHTVIKLSDGTEVWMNARSSLRYPSRFDQKERKVELNGEAFFNVASLENKKPFTVSTSTLDVRVLGTSFNIKEDETNSVNVSLVKGSIEVNLHNNTSKSIRLKPMQNLSYKNGQAKIMQLHDEDNFLWKQGILFFNKLSLSEIAKKIEWHYDTHIIINDPEIGKHTYSGKFRQQDGPHEIIRILQKSQNFRFKKDDINNIFILDKY